MVTSVILQIEVIMSREQDWGPLLSASLGALSVIVVWVIFSSGLLDAALGR